jgi:hypothetical protein
MTYKTGLFQAPVVPQALWQRRRTLQPLFRIKQASRPKNTGATSYIFRSALTF